MCYLSTRVNLSPELHRVSINLSHQWVEFFFNECDLHIIKITVRKVYSKDVHAHPIEKCTINHLVWCCNPHAEKWVWELGYYIKVALQVCRSGLKLMQHSSPALFY